MLTVLEMNPEGYVNRIFEGNTLEEFLKDVTEYFSSEGYEDDLEIILEQAKQAYRKEVNEYVYFDANSRRDNYFLAHDDELIRAEIEGILAGNSLDVFDMNEAKETLEYYYGENNVFKFEVIEFKYNTLDSRCVDNIEEFKATLEKMGAEIVYSEKYQVGDFIGAVTAEKMLVVNLKLLEGHGEFYTYQQISEILNSKYNLNELTKEEYLEIVNFLDSGYCISSGYRYDPYTHKQVVYIKDREDYCNKLYEHLQYNSLEEFEEDKEDIDIYWKGEGLYDYWNGVFNYSMDYYMKLEDCVNELLDIYVEKE